MTQAAFLTSLILLSVISAFSQSTAFTYQGRLSSSGVAANTAHDMEFRLFDMPAVGTGIQHGDPVTLFAVPVTNGVFTVQLDFGDCSTCFDGAPRFIQISVKPAGGATFIELSPRQPLTSAPYAVKSLIAENTNQLGGIAAEQYVVTTDPRMTDARDPLPDSTFYIQNTAQQRQGRFNLIGSGAVTGTLTATQYNIGPNRILSLFDTNLFTGRNSGKDVLPGQRNSFFGNNSGEYINNGSDNSLHGHQAGSSVVNGNNNSYFGSNAGRSNDGNNNSFFGKDSGNLNSFTNDSTFIGYLAGANAGGFTNATAIGSRAIVAQSNSLVLGSISNVNGATADTLVGIGTMMPSAKLHVGGWGSTRVRISADYALYGDAGLTFALNEQNKWTVHVQENGFFKINNESLGSDAFTISGSNNQVGIAGNLNVAGTISGNGSGLTNLNTALSTTVVTATLSVPGGTFRNVTATCPMSHPSVTGGGFELPDGAGNLADIMQSRPFTSPAGWTVRVRNSVLNSFDVTVWAVCAR